MLVLDMYESHQIELVSEKKDAKKKHTKKTTIIITLGV